MHPIAKKCLIAALPLLIFGFALSAGPAIGSFLGTGIGMNPQSQLSMVLYVLLSHLANVLIPLGAVLIGAAAVIHALAPAESHRVLSRTKAEEDQG